MRPNLKISGFFFLMLAFSACYEDDIISTETVDLADPIIVYLNTIHGQVLDTLGNPIPFAEVSSEGLSAETDGEGRFSLVDLPISSIGTFIAAEHPDYYEGGIRVYANAPVVQNVQMNLVPRGSSKNFSNNDGITFNLNGLGQVNIEPNTFMTEGQLYEGNVNLEFYLVNPKDYNSLQKRLQVFEIYDSQTSDRVLKSDFSSMMYINAVDGMGRDLDIKEDKQVTVYMPTYESELMNNGRLYSFDDRLGFWNAEGSVEVAGEYYKVTLPHFSWWGVGLQKFSSSLCLTFSSDTPTDGHLFTVSTTSGQVLQLGGVNYGTEICFPVSAGDDLEIRVFNSCFVEIYSTAVTAAGQGEAKYNIEVPMNAASGYNINVSVLDCDANPFQDSVTLFYATQLSMDLFGRGVGEFELLLDECFNPQDLYLTVIQEDGPQTYTYTAQLSINESNRQYDIDIVACQDVMPEDGHLTINGIAYTQVEARRNPQETLIVAKDGPAEVLIGIDGFIVGVFPARLIAFENNVFCEGTVEILHYGEVGDFIQGILEIPENTALGCSAASGEFMVQRVK